MSLKLFHIVFVIVSIALALLVGGWGVWEYARAGRALGIVLAVLGFAGGVLLVRYSFWFVRKLKGVDWQ